MQYKLTPLQQLCTHPKCQKLLNKEKSILDIFISIISESPFNHQLLRIGVIRMKIIQNIQRVVYFVKNMKQLKYVTYILYILSIAFFHSSVYLSMHKFNCFMILSLSFFRKMKASFEKCALFKKFFVKLLI